MDKKQLSPELRAAFAALDAHEQSPDLDVASLHTDRAKAYALVSIAQSLEKLTHIAEQEEERKRSTPEGF